MHYEHAVPHAQTLVLYNRYTGATTASRIGTTAGHSGPFGNDFVYLKVRASAWMRPFAPAGGGSEAICLRSGCQACDTVEARAAK